MSEAAHDIDGDGEIVAASADRYTAFCRDFGFAWQWEIQKEGEEIYSGAALSEAAAWRAIAAVARAFGISLHEGAPAPATPTGEQD